VNSLPWRVITIISLELSPSHTLFSRDDMDVSTISGPNMSDPLVFSIVEKINKLKGRIKWFQQYWTHFSFQMYQLFSNNLSKYRLVEWFFALFDIYSHYIHTYLFVLYTATCNWIVCTKSGKWAVCYIPPHGIGLSVPSQESERCVIYRHMSLDCLYQVRKVSGVLYTATCHWIVCTKSGKWAVCYMPPHGIGLSVPSQESERSYKYMLC
jgi:hypothetical protein